MNLNDKMVDALAAQIARDIFALGDEPKSPANRMQYKGGKWPGHELDQGGIGEKPLAEFIAKRLRTHLTPNAQVKRRPAEGGTSA